MNRTDRVNRHDMVMSLGRREFLALGVGAAVALMFPAHATAIEPFVRKRPSHLKLSLAAYSYREYLSGEQKSMDLFDFVTLAADLAVDAVELTSYSISTS